MHAHAHAGGGLIQDLSNCQDRGQAQLLGHLSHFLGLRGQRIQHLFGTAADSGRHRITEIAHQLIQQQPHFDAALQCGIQFRQRTRRITLDEPADKPTQPLSRRDTEQIVDVAGGYSLAALR